MTAQKRAKTKGVPPELTVREITKDRRGINIEGDKLLTDKSNVKFLGLTLNNNLSWEAHLTGGKKPILPAVRRVLGMINKISRHMKVEARLKLVNALALSKLTYMISQWGHTTPNHSKKAQVVLNHGARIITGKLKSTRITDLMSDCRWLTIDQLTEYHSLMELWKIIRWKTPSYFSDKFSIDNDDVISTSRPRLQLTAMGFRHMSVYRWNRLPSHLRSINRITTFKRALKKWIFERDSNTDDASLNDEDDVTAPGPGHPPPGPPGPGHPPALVPAPNL